MSATLTSRNTSAAPRKHPRGRGQVVSRRCAAALEATYRQLHAQIIADKRPVSGRAGRYVYYWAYGHLCWRAYVIPKDPRTAVQQRSRAAFAAASTAWSERQPLTEEQRVAWYAEAAKIKSAPRLGQSGPLTAQQHFVGRNSLKERWGLALLSEPRVRERKNAEGRRQNPEPAAQVRLRKAVVHPSSGTRRACAGPAPAPHPLAEACPRQALDRFPCSQVQFPQHLTRPSSDRLRTTTGPCPGQHRCHARSSKCDDGGDLPRWPFSLPQIRRNARSHELWRGT